MIYRSFALLCLVAVLASCGGGASRAYLPIIDMPNRIAEYTDSSALIGLWRDEHCREATAEKHHAYWKLGLKFEAHHFVYRVELFSDAECKQRQLEQFSDKFGYGIGATHGEGRRFDFWPMNATDRPQFSIYGVEVRDGRDVLSFGKSPSADSAQRPATLDHGTEFTRL